MSSSSVFIVLVFFVYLQYNSYHNKVQQDTLPSFSRRSMTEALYFFNILLHFLEV